jgi:hypothetical protein
LETAKREDVIKYIFSEKSPMSEVEESYELLEM